MGCFALFCPAQQGVSAGNARMGEPREIWVDQGRPLGYRLNWPIFCSPREAAKRTRQFESLQRTLSALRVSSLCRLPPGALLLDEWRKLDDSGITAMDGVDAAPAAAVLGFAQALQTFGVHLPTAPGAIWGADTPLGQLWYQSLAEKGIALALPGTPAPWQESRISRMAYVILAGGNLPVQLPRGCMLYLANPKPDTPLPPRGILPRLQPPAPLSNISLWEGYAIAEHALKGLGITPADAAYGAAVLEREGWTVPQVLFASHTLASPAACFDAQALGRTAGSPHAAVKMRRG